MAADNETKPASTAASAAAATETDKQKDNQPKAATLGEDDEFEDFPIDDWPEDQTEAAASQGNEQAKHLWEESWDDDDTTDDFSAQLREELKKVNASGRR